MAVLTQRVAAFDDESVVVSFDWDDATGSVVALRVVNGSTSSVWGRIEGTGSGPAGRSREGTFGPGTAVVTIPGGQQPRYPVVVTDGVADVGGYVFAIRFPA